MAVEALKKLIALADAAEGQATVDPDAVAEVAADARVALDETDLYPEEDW